MRMNMTRIFELWKGLGGLIDLLEMEFEPLDDGEIVCRMPIRTKHTGGPGIAHGGATMALLDTALGARAFTWALTQERLSSTVEMKVHFLKPVREGTTLKSKTSILSAGKSIITVQGELVDESSGESLAFATGTFNVYQSPMVHQVLELVRIEEK